MKKGLLILFILLASSVFAQEYIITFEDEPVLSNVSSQISSLVKEKQFTQLENIENALEKRPSKRDSQIIRRSATVEKNEKRVKKTFSHALNGALITASVDELRELQAQGLIKAFYENKKVSILLNEKIPLLGVPLVWDFSNTSSENITGQGITVAVLDSGVDYTHPDLGNCTLTANINTAGCNKVIGGYDSINLDNDPMDDQGHGTHVAGIVAANGSVKGVAPDAQILAYKVLNSAGSGSFDTILDGLDRAVADGANVITMSLGAFCGLDNYTSDCGPDDVVSQTVDTISRSGISVVVAAGNDGRKGPNSVATPGTAVEAITVGALDNSTTIADYSSYGPVNFTNGTGSFSLIKPNIVTYGTEICSAQSSQDKIWDSNNNYDGRDIHCYDTKHINISGTSMATPFIAGMLALSLQKNQDWKPSQVKTALYNTTTVIDGISAHKQGFGSANVTQFVQFTKNLTANLTLTQNLTHLFVNITSNGTDYKNVSVTLDNNTIYQNSSPVINQQIYNASISTLTNLTYNFTITTTSTDLFSTSSTYIYNMSGPVPLGISNLSVINRTKTNITLNWSNPDNFTFIRVSYNQSQIDLPNTTTNYTFANLSMETQHTFSFNTGFTTARINTTSINITVSTQNKSRVNNVNNISVLSADENYVELNWTNPTENYNDTIISQYKNNSLVNTTYTNKTKKIFSSSPNANYTFTFQTRSTDGWLNISSVNITQIIGNNSVPTFTINNLTQNSSNKTFRLDLTLDETVIQAYYYIERFYNITSNTINISGYFNDTYNIYPYISNNSINKTFPAFNYGKNNITFVFTDEWNGTNKTTLTLNITKYLGGNSTDFDNDGINDSVDTLIGNESTFYTDEIVNITIFNQTNSSSNLTQVFRGQQNISVKINNSELFVFDHNFSNKTLDISDLSIYSRSENTSKIAISGLNITGYKTIYFTLIGNTTKNSAICVWNAPANSLSTMSDDCSGLGESYIEENTTFVYPNKSVNGTVKKINQSRWVLKNMLHTGVTQVCSENWSYSSWSSCSGGTQTRTATDVNACGTTRNRLSLTQSCTNPAPDNDDDDSSGGSTSSSSGGGSNSGTYYLPSTVDVNETDENETQNNTSNSTKTNITSRVNISQLQNVTENESETKNNSNQNESVKNDSTAFIKNFSPGSLPTYMSVILIISFIIIGVLVTRAIIAHRRLHKYGRLF